MLLAYFGPETFVPVASVIATVVGVGMMLGRHAIRLAFAPLRIFAMFLKRPGQSTGAANTASPGSTHAPHFRSLEKRRMAARETTASSSPEA